LWNSWRDFVRIGDMPSRHPIRRYSAFFQGWAQAFGNHRGSMDDDRTLNWLFGEDEDQIGLILTHQLRHDLFHKVLGEHLEEVHLTLEKSRIGVEELVVDTGYRDEQAVRALRNLLDDGKELHLYLTYHLFYPSGTRILTLSRNVPLPLIYKEIAPLTIVVD
jgi:hypothetical protein